MGSVAVLASGSGTNFQAIYDDLSGSPHAVVGLICDHADAPVVGRAKALGIPSVVIDYRKAAGGKRAAESRLAEVLREWDPDVIALAGFMRILSPGLVHEFEGRLVNIHPSLLPRHPGLDAITRSYDSADPVVGITVHFVDDGVDSGKVIRQERMERRKGEQLADFEARIHMLEHRTYPGVIRDLLAAPRAGGPREAPR